MEYPDSINDELTSIDENNIKYIDISENPEFIYGKISFTSKSLNLNKFSKTAMEKIDKSEDFPSKIHRLSPSCRLRFKTNSKRLIIKAEIENVLSKKYGDCQSSLDIYELEYDRYIERCVINMDKGNNILVEEIELGDNKNICIFLPNLEIIKNLHIGIDRDCEIERLDYLGENKLPLIVCGNEYTMGLYASKSGNNISNLISRYLDQDVIDLSYFGCSVGISDVADIIGKINCYSVVIDYNRNIEDYGEFKKSMEVFFNRIRKYHPDIKIIFIASSAYNTEEENGMIAMIISEIPDIKNNPNTIVINHGYDKEENITNINKANIDKYNYELREIICENYRNHL